jgi:hypothetical protein
VASVHPASQPDWDASLARDPRATIFHSAAWAEVLAGAYGYAPHYFAIHEAGAVKSLLPLMEVNSSLTGRRGVSLPFTDECEPIFSDPDSFKRLVQSATALGRQRGWKYVEFRGGRNLFGYVPASLSFYGHDLALTGGEEQLFGRVDGSIRRAIRKAEKEGVKVEVTDTLEAVRTFYSLLCQTRKRHGLPPQPFALFQNIHRHVLARKLGVLVLATFSGQPIAAGVYFGFGARATYKYGASDARFQHLRGNNLVMWEAIKWHAAQGFQNLHLGRTSLGNDGLRRFKLNWGAAEHPIQYVKYDLRHDRFLADKDESDGWHNQVFRRLPLFISKMAGAALYRHWA